MSVRLLCLGDICKPKQWATLAKKDMAQEGYPVYGANGVIGFASTFTHTAPVILVGCRGSCGSVHVTVPMAYANGNAMALDSLDSTVADITYVARFLARRGFRDVTTGTSQPQIIRSNIVTIQIPLPPLLEQKRIAAILDAADALRAKRRESIEQLDSLIQATFLEMFGDPVTNPKGWELVPLGEVTSCLDRLRTPVKEEERKAGSVPYYGANGQQGWIDSHIFDEPLVLVAEDGGHFDNPSRGVAYRITGLSWVNNHAHVLRPLPKINIEYLHRTLRHYDFTPYVSGTTRAKLNQKQLSRAPVLLPPLPLQTGFASIVESIEHQKARLIAHLAELDTLFASLQSRAFNGELVA